MFDSVFKQFVSKSLSVDWVLFWLQLLSAINHVIDQFGCVASQNVIPRLDSSLLSLKYLLKLLLVPLVSWVDQIHTDLGTHSRQSHLHEDHECEQQVVNNILLED